MSAAKIRHLIAAPDSPQPAAAMQIGSFREGVAIRFLRAQVAGGS
jgi:hypothetical protein